ncbi:protein translocase subunit SecF [Marinicella sp. W31]|uniref:protein translocase subunit SecF n=1 Tax=Marinicella sp. W31 TaxID=3023713 RepID=UPI0037583CF2
MNLLGKINIDFMAKRKVAMYFSIVLIIASLSSLVVRGLNFGLDFTGGTVVVVNFKESVDIPKIRNLLAEKGQGDAAVKQFGSSTDIEIALPPSTQKPVDADGNPDESAESELSNEILDIIRNDSGYEIDKFRVEFVGPQVGKELVEQGSLALLYAIIGILIYVTFRFEWRFSLGAVAALVHDVIITAGVFSITQVEFDLTVLAALLAVIGYSLNDTIVVFDRVRENFIKIRKKNSEEVFNISINQTLARTVITSLTTLLVLFALYIFGGAMINAFAFALIVGVLIGTYSSIFVASTFTLALGISRQDLIPIQKEGVDLDHIP